VTTVVIGDNTGDDFAGTIDTYLKEQTPTANNGTSQYLEVTKWNVGDHTHGLLGFPGLSNIPASATVTAATLSLFLADSGAYTHTISLYRLLKNWVELEATWNIYSTGNSWDTAGALASTDRSSTLSASASVDGTLDVYKNFTGAQLTTDVQNKVSGVNSNFGWHGERTDGGANSQFKKFRASDGADGERPKLSVTYTHVGVRAIVELLATAGVGGAGLQKLVYAVTFFGDDVPAMAETEGQRQLEIEVNMPNNFTLADLRAAIVVAVQAKAIEVGLTIADADVLTLSGASA
jgi:hypothetical protein